MKIYRLVLVFLLLLSLPAVAAAAEPHYARPGDSLYDGVVCLQAPEKNVVWQTGTERRISWTYDGVTGARVDILLLRGYKPVAAIASWVEIGKGGYNWQIPAGLEPGDDYVIKVKSALFPWCYGFSDKFSLAAGN